MIAPARKPNLRWIAPAAAAGLVIASPALLTTVANAEPALPDRNADEIIAQVLGADPVAFTGELSQTMELGLPSLGFETGVDFTNPNALWSLASGTNTWRLWYDGGNSYRVAVIRGQSESDLISNGQELWAWSNQSQTAVRTELGAGDGEHLPRPAAPQDLARELLTSVEQYSSVSTDMNRRIAGRAAYEVTITPTDTSTRVQQVKLAVDAETWLPLRLQVFSTTSSDPAIEIGFTKINYTQPNASVFEFTPPPGAEVIETNTPGEITDTASEPTTGPTTEQDEVVKPRLANVVGEGWSQITVVEGGDTQLPGSQFTELLPRVQGDWGSGVLLDGSLVSFVLADDGRMAFGAVSPDALYQALTR